MRNPAKAPELDALLAKYPKERSAIIKLDVEDVNTIKSAVEEVTKLLPNGLDNFVGSAGFNPQPTAVFESL